MQSRIKENANVLNSVSFKKLEKMNMGEALSTLFFEEGFQRYSFYQCAKEFVSVLFLRKLVFSSSSHGKHMLFWTSAYSSRKDYWAEFNKVVSVIDEPITVVNQRKFNVDFNKIKRLHLLLVWMKQMRNLPYSMNFRLHCCFQIFQGYNVMQEVGKHIDLKQITPKLAVTFFDVGVDDYFLTHMLKSKGIKTATLQHALFNHKTHGWAYEFSHSDFFLAINEYAKNEAYCSDYVHGQIKVVGAMKYIGKEDTVVRKATDTKKVGVLLSGPAFAIDNEFLLECGKVLRDEFGYKVCVRSHPAINLDDYSSKIDITGFDICEKGVSMEEYASECDFAILGQTPVFVDLLYIECPVFRAVKYGDLFESEEKLRFSDVNDLTEMVNWFISRKEECLKNMREAKKYLAYEGNVTEGYRSFFGELK